MTNTITVTIPAGNFETAADAAALAKSYERVCAVDYPHADVTVTVIARQTGGGKTIVEIDGDEDETAAHCLDYVAAKYWTSQRAYRDYKAAIAASATA